MAGGEAPVREQVFEELRQGQAVFDSFALLGLKHNVLVAPTGGMAPHASTGVCMPCCRRACRLAMPPHAAPGRREPVDYTDDTSPA